jgi:hypothetical protein
VHFNRCVHRSSQNKVYSLKVHVWTNYFAELPLNRDFEQLRILPLAGWQDSDETGGGIRLKRVAG